MKTAKIIFPLSHTKYPSANRCYGLKGKGSIVRLLLVFLIVFCFSSNAISKPPAPPMSPEKPDPSQQGPFKVAKQELRIKGKDIDLQAHIYIPKAKQEDASFPVILFSPGGDAKLTSLPSYAPLMSHLATYGYVVIVIAFDGDTAVQRAQQFSKVIDCIQEKATSKDSDPYSGIDIEKIIVAGHSRGGLAALLAAAADKRITHCIGIEASHPVKERYSFEERSDVAVLLIAGDYETVLTKAMLDDALELNKVVIDGAVKGLDKAAADAVRSQIEAAIAKGMVSQPGMDAANAHWGMLQSPRALLQISNMNHQLQPNASSMVMRNYIISWLNWKAYGKENWRTFVDGKEADSAKKAGHIASIKIEE